MAHSGSGSIDSADDRSRLLAIVEVERKFSFGRRRRRLLSYSSTPGMSMMLTNEDFEAALKKSHASKLTSQRKAMIPNVRWSDIGGLATAKKEILNTIQLPLLHPDLFGSLAR